MTDMVGQSVKPWIAGIFRLPDTGSTFVSSPLVSNGKSPVSPDCHGRCVRPCANPSAVPLHFAHHYSAPQRGSDLVGLVSGRAASAL